jgi:hypothetical protein
MLAIRSIAYGTLFIALLDCRQDDRPPVMIPSEPANPADSPEPRVPAPNLPPERSDLQLDQGPGTGPIAANMNVGGFAGGGGAGGAAGAGGMSASGGTAATSPQPIH